MRVRLVEVVARPVEVRGEQEDRVRAVLLAVGLGADEHRLLRHAVRGVGLLGVPVPELVLVERDGRELRVGADGADDHELLRPVQPRLLEHVRAHHQVGVPVAARVRAVRADPADLGREVVDELGVRVREEALRVVHRRQVVVALPRRDDVVAVVGEPLDEPGAEEPAAAGDEHAAHAALRCFDARTGSAATGSR